MHFIALDVSVEFVLIYRPHPVFPGPEQMTLPTLHHSINQKPLHTCTWYSDLGFCNRMSQYYKPILMCFLILCAVVTLADNFKESIIPKVR